MEITPPVKLHITMTIPADSAVEVERILLTAQEEPQDLVDNCSPDNDVLVITPDYPSTHNLYLCAFAHSRNREYIGNGLNTVSYTHLGGTSFHKIDYQVNPNLRVIRVGGGFTVHKSLDYFDVFNMNSISEYIHLEKYVRDCDLIWTGYPGWYNLISRYKGKKLVYDKMCIRDRHSSKPHHPR